MLVHPTPPSPQQYIIGAHSYLCVETDDVETVQAGLCLAIGTLTTAAHYLNFHSPPCVYLCFLSCLSSLSFCHLNFFLHFYLLFFCLQNSPLNQDSTKMIAEPTLDEKPSLMVNGHSEHMPSASTESRDNTLKPMDHDSVLNGSETIGFAQETLGVHGNATEDVDASKESNSFDAQGNTSPLYSTETSFEENSSHSFDIGGPVSFDIGSPVSGTLSGTPKLDSVESVSCAVELMQENMQICELVKCTESLPEEVCEVTMVESDDNESFCSIGSMNYVAQTREIVTEHVTTNVEVEPLSPVKKALISRG